MNLLTHPVLWFVAMPALVPVVGWAIAVALAESAVIVVEALTFAVLLDLDAAEAAMVSVLVNAGSFLCGLVLAEILW